METLRTLVASQQNLPGSRNDCVCLARARHNFNPVILSKPLDEFVTKYDRSLLVTQRSHVHFRDIRRGLCRGLCLRGKQDEGSNEATEDCKVAVLTSVSIMLE